jgi:hypothetical protein
VETNTITSRLAEGEQRYLLLLQEATDLLKKVDIIAMEELTALLDRRQNLVHWIQDFDRRLSDVDSVEPSACAALAAFRIFQAETVKKILDIDGLVIALGKKRSSTIKTTLSTFAKGKQVRLAFDSSGIMQQHHLNDIL